MIKQYNRVPTLRELYPHLSDDKLTEVEERIDRHIRIVMDMYERISADPVEYAKLKKKLAELRSKTQDC